MKFGHTNCYCFSTAYSRRLEGTIFVKEFLQNEMKANANEKEKKKHFRLLETQLQLSFHPDSVSITLALTSISTKIVYLKKDDFQNYFSTRQKFLYGLCGFWQNCGPIWENFLVPNRKRRSGVSGHPTESFPKR